MTSQADLKTLNHEIDAAYAEWQKEPESIERKSDYSLKKQAFDEKIKSLRARYFPSVK
jgi:flagellar motility protein MotE (MotC chaperone)